MGLFKKKPQSQEGAEGTRRDIPSLNPSFYTAALRRADKPTTESNIAAVAGLTAWNLTLNAHRWMDALGEHTARSRWDQQFTGFGEDADRAVQMPDAMIDFLWDLNPRLHPGLREFVDGMRETIPSASSAFGSSLPLDMWRSE